jgi:adenylate kinase
MKCIILLASPGAGKGTASDYIENKYGYKHISTGSLLRNEALVNEEIKSLIDKGLFVSDETVMNVLKRNINNENIILDGMPRNINQAIVLKELLEEKNIELEKVIFIDIDKEIAAKRIENRLTCDRCKRVYNKELINSKVCMICGGNLISREDDTKEVFEERYNTYINETKPLVDYYKDKIVKIYNNDTLESLYSNLDKEMI